ncbi:MAG: hypothetical protein E7L36_05435 [Prevotella bivia]|uniref:hypothetical protein n=2 Tax=Prevotellaceae TaxID=171552 RepID=UPI00254C80DB|nr:hypothetical protein [Prevotella bivia]MBS6327979.1 hypothetical protein [Prevotella bivia]MDU7315122.1 hypothetical protein [Prevotella bivia]MDZ3818625.1 hypothetical protein [Prevotella bivia]
MKTKSFISFAVCVAVSVLMCSCSNEESADSNSNGQLTAFTGGIVTEAPMERMQLSSPEISTEVPGFLTRTSMNRNGIGGQGAFLWEPKDVIYVEDDNGKLYKSQNTINDAVARATFFVDGSYTTKGQYDVYYCGTNSGASEKKVVIASDQTQVAFNNTKHFGAAGDCGVAKATKTTVSGKSGYRFDLEHKASYLCFLPYMAPQWDRANLKLKSIEITSDNNIAGTYDLTQAGLSGTGNSKTITLNVGRDGLKLADQATATKSIKNSLYVVIAPGTHALKVKYTVLDAKNTVMTITKSYKSHNFGANKICDIPVNLGVRHYSGHNYYMWDARENYWFGHEWDAADPWQPTTEGAENDGYPRSKTADASRWYHEGEGPFEASVNPLFKKLPNANEMGWYVLRGDAHWDDSTCWEVFGELHTGGLWLKKLSVIAQENGRELAALKQADPNGKNLLTSSDYYSISPENGKPADSEIGKYFFLPALGYYDSGELNDLGFGGYYWSSSATPGKSSCAFYLNFYSGGVRLFSYSYRYYGFVTQPFE